MKTYQVKGMTCASCQIAVEKAVKKVPGIQQCSVSLLTNSMVVEGSASESDIIEAVDKAGYQVVSLEKKQETSFGQETKEMVHKFLWSLGLGMVLMYFSMGYLMFNFPVPSFFQGNYLAIGLLQAMLATGILVLNRSFFQSGLKSLVHGQPNMDTLVSLGSGISYVWSVRTLFLLTKVSAMDQMTLVHRQFYFESSAMILVFILLGKSLESYSKGKTTSALQALMNLSPQQARKLVDEKEVMVSVEEVELEDIILVKAGEKVPVDGVILLGQGSVDESMLSGESLPVDKKPGDKVIAGSLNQSGYLRIKTTEIGENTTLSQIIELVKQASLSKAPIAKIADKISAVFVPAVIAIALLVFVIWMIIGRDVSLSLQHAVSVLVIACPCALGLATPVAIMVGSGKGYQNGLLFKTSSSLEEISKMDIFVFDKTGTITKGKPEVVDWMEVDPQLWEVAYALESKSEHPLAKAVVSKALEKQILLKEVINYQTLVGHGVKASLENQEIIAGSYQYISSIVTLEESLKIKIESQQAVGRTALLFVRDGQLVGIIYVTDTLKEDSKQAIEALQQAGRQVVMLTGDGEKTADAIAKEVGVKKVISQVLPQEKEKVISFLQNYGKVAMVGDGINDAPALTRADLGVAIGAGTDVAMDSADIVLSHSSLLDLVQSSVLSQETVRIIHQNFFWAFIYNLLLVPLATGFIPGLEIEPMWAALAMAFSSVTVVLNGLRLNHISLEKELKSKRIVEIPLKEWKEKKAMNKVIKVEGMMCGHCEMSVKKGLEGIEGVLVDSVSHETGLVKLNLSKEVSEEEIKKVIEELEYSYQGIQK